MDTRNAAATGLPFVCVFFYIILALPHMPGSFLICQWQEKDVHRCENKHSPPREYSTHSYLTLRWAYAWPVCKTAWFIFVQPQLLLWPKSSRVRTASHQERSADAPEWTLQRAGKQKILFEIATSMDSKYFSSKQRPAEQSRDTTHQIIAAFLSIRKCHNAKKKEIQKKSDKCYKGSGM